MKTFHVYIMANEARTIYIGVTSDLERRVWQHKTGAVPGFTSKYRLTNLVYISEDFDSAGDAISWEKQLKGWRRAKKLALISGQNPTWDDLAADWFTQAVIPRDRGE
jgi:putative endonuclease